MINFTDLKGEHLDAAADLWTQGWADGHLGLVPEALVRMRTQESFRNRLWDHRAETRVALAGKAVLGFYIIVADELYQFYVGAEARGTGLASEMMSVAEDDLRDGGHKIAWLGCSVGNNRAARFYEKMGWINRGVERFDAYTETGPVPTEVWRFEKTL